MQMGTDDMHHVRAVCHADQICKLFVPRLLSQRDVMLHMRILLARKVTRFHHETQSSPQSLCAVVFKSVNDAREKEEEQISPFRALVVTVVYLPCSPCKFSGNLEECKIVEFAK